MTVADLKSLTSLREIFPTEIQMDWSIEEYNKAQRACEQRVLVGLDEWRDKNAQQAENQESATNE